MDAMRRTMAPAVRVALVVVVSGVAVAAIAMWLMEPYEPPLPTTTCALSDRSDSMVTDLGCGFVVSVSAQTILSPGVAKGSRLFIYGTGDVSTDLEPIQIGAYEIPTSERVTDGGEAVGVARKALLRRISADCRNVGNVATVSPIFLSVKRAMEQLSAFGCGSKSICCLYVRTEGEETEEPWLREAIREGKMKPSGLPVALDNSHVAVTFCGLSETAHDVRKDEGGKRDKSKSASASADFRKAAWRKVFTKPVVFLPFCPRLDAEEETAARIQNDANVSPQ